MVASDQGDIKYRDDLLSLPVYSECFAHCALQNNTATEMVLSGKDICMLAGRPTGKHYLSCSYTGRSYQGREPHMPRKHLQKAQADRCVCFLLVFIERSPVKQVFLVQFTLMILRLVIAQLFIKDCGREACFSLNDLSSILNSTGTLQNREVSRMAPSSC